MSLVEFSPPEPMAAHAAAPGIYPFTRGKAYVFLGEIPNMPGHCVVAERENGRIHAGFHTDLFTELASNET